jgi:hypothetical protein
MAGAFTQYLGFERATRRRNALRRQARLETLDLDQRVRELGEW